MNRTGGPPRKPAAPRKPPPPKYPVPPRNRASGLAAACRRLIAYEFALYARCVTPFEGAGAETIVAPAYVAISLVLGYIAVIVGLKLGGRGSA